MLKVVFVVAIVALVAASPRSLAVQKQVHEIAKSVKSDNSYSFEEKKELLASLKEMNQEAKDFEAADEDEKDTIKADLKDKVAQLKTKMHKEEKQVESHVSKKHSFEEDSSSKIEAVSESLKAFKADLKTRKLSTADQRATKKLVSQLEEEYSQLSTATKTERKEIAKSMRAAVAELRDYLPADEVTAPKVSSSSSKISVPKVSHHFEEDTESKKDKVRQGLKSFTASSDYTSLPSAAKTRVDSILKKMKHDLEGTQDVSEIKSKLQSKMSSITEIVNENKPQPKAAAPAEEEDEQEEEKELEEDPENEKEQEEVEDDE